MTTRSPQIVRAPRTRRGPDRVSTRSHPQSSRKDLEMTFVPRATFAACPHFGRKGRLIGREVAAHSVVGHSPDVDAPPGPPYEPNFVAHGRLRSLCLGGWRARNPRRSF